MNNKGDFYVYHIPNMMYSRGMYAKSKEEVMNFIKTKITNSWLLENTSIQKINNPKIEFIESWLEEADFSPKIYSKEWKKINQTQYVIEKDDKKLLIVEIDKDLTFAGDFVVRFTLSPVDKKYFIQGVPLNNQFHDEQLETILQCDKDTILDELEYYEIDFDWVDIDNYRNPRDNPEYFPENDWDE